MIELIRRYGLENFQQNLERLDAYLLRNKGKELVAIFDIGTKACRLLVAPKEVPEKEANWNKETFFNDGQVFNLGSDYNRYEREVDVDKSIPLEGIIFFISTYKAILVESGVSPRNIVACGTAVFRWMKNQKAVIDKIYQNTGIKLVVLQDDDEALLSLFSVYHTYKFGLGDEKDGNFKDNDVILLFDQGGGSTEISYFHPSQLKIDKLDSINELGTVALQENFFTLNEKERINPEANRRRISKQFSRINQFIEEKVVSWKGFPEINQPNVNIYAYGMGSALSKFLGTGNNFNQNNKILTIDGMNRRLQEYCSDLDNEKGEVRKLYEAVNSRGGEDSKKLERKLVFLYGLPAYIKLLEKFNLKQLCFAGYGLRYGLYIALYKIKWGHTLFFDSEHVVVTRKRPRVFISYSAEDDSHNNWVRKLSADLREKYGIDAHIWDYQPPGTNLDHFMEKSVREADKVLVIYTPLYKKKAENLSAGVGKEYHLIVAESGKNMVGTKFIPILRKGTGNDSITLFHSSLFRVDMDNDLKYVDNLEKLNRGIIGQGIVDIPSLKEI